MSNIVERIEVPTGDICIMRGAHGLLEFLSIGDYGKAKNLKADFLGLHDEIDGVPHGELLPLTEKWVVTISTQYGCDMGCTFCDVPKVGKGHNATLQDMQLQVINGIQLHPEIERTNRLNVHFARMGEPTWNPAVLDMGKWLYDHIHDTHCCHPVVSTMMPARNEWLKTFVHTWIRIKNRVFKGEAGLQLSINSTDEKERLEMFRGNALPLYQIGRMLDGAIPVGRKFTLNFALAGYTIDPAVLLRYFPPEAWICKLTPMHNTATAQQHGIETDQGYVSYTPYRETERALKDAGYDVIVFVPSLEEDESRITCGNAILAQAENQTP